MEIVKKVINNVPVTFVKTKKFKSVVGKLYFKSKVTRENINTRSLLKSVLIECTKKYDTNEKLNINCLENYDAYYNASVSRLGNYITNSFFFGTLSDDYTKKGNLENVIDTFCEIIFNPNVTDKKFDDKSFNLNFKRLKTAYERRMENQRSYAELRLLKHLNQDKPYSYDIDLEFLEKITPNSLYEEYLDMLNNSMVSLIVVGDVDENDKVYEKILSNIKVNKEYDFDLFINNDDENDAYKEIIEKADGTQSVLHMICYLKDITDYELHYVLPLYKSILGNSGSSRLFNTVREENSLAYYAFARLEKDDKYIDLIAGIEKENYEKSVRLIKEELQKMNKVTDEELENAKKDLISALRESEDNITNVLSRRRVEEIFSLPSTTEFIQKLSNVTKEEVEQMHNKVHLNFSYFLQGCDNNG